MKRIGVLISGRGTNLQALIDAQQRGELGGEIVIVISNKSKAMGLERARKAGINTEIITKKQYPVREDHDRAVVEALKAHRVDLVVLAGYMRILTEVFIDAFRDRIINVHPSLLPAFKGVKAQWQAVEYGVKVSGCTTHFVTLDMDAGPIILQKAVPVFDDDTGETLAERILPEEHRILVRSVRLFCEDKLVIEGRRVRILEGE
ncbi:MAG: phosphoribosylglycinamide formyltransferase [Candidatus Thorarchaeota archaeon]|nr:MAG: phosphoribosylglycinamide formyltransferase [Candidatus Thorarchaeota archaeon]